MISKKDRELFYELKDTQFPFFHIIGKVTQVGQYKFKQYEYKFRPQMLIEKKVVNEGIEKDAKSVPYKSIQWEYKAGPKILTEEEKVFWFGVFEKAKIDF